MTPKTLIKNASLPWHSSWMDLPTDQVRPFFGFFAKKFGGPDLKIRKLRSNFGNDWRNPNLIYVVSGKPLPLRFVEKMKSRGRKIVLNQNGVFFPAWYSGDCNAANQTLRRYHELADYVFFQSEYCFNTTKNFVQPPETPNEILYNGVDTNLFKPAHRPRLGPEIKIVASAYINPTNDYNLSSLFQTIRLLNEKSNRHHLFLAGKIQGSHHWIEKLARKWGVSSVLHLMGEYTLEQLADIYNKMDVYAHLKLNDACPSSILEAMASGLPVVYLKSGGAPELVGDTGIGIDVQDSFDRRIMPTPEAVAEAIQEATKNKTDFGVRARKRTESLFTIENWLSRHDETFKKLILEHE